MDAFWTEVLKLPTYINTTPSKVLAFRIDFGRMCNISDAFVELLYWVNKLLCLKCWSNTCCIQLAVLQQSFFSG